MAAIYDKALKRKDFSGVIRDENAKAEAGDGKDKAKKKDGKDGKDENDPAAAGAADVGKIVNLMAGDASRVSSSSSCPSRHSYSVPVTTDIRGSLRNVSPLQRTF